jgi:arylsulfatase
VPENAKTPALHERVKKWDSLSAEEKALQARGMEVYAGMVSNMDYHLGRVVSFLKDIGEYDNTVILFLSDNGPNPWFSDDYPGNRGSKFMAQFDNSKENIGRPMSHYAYGNGWASASAGPLDLFKMTVGEGGIRSPLIISGPGVKGGRQTDAFAYVTDIMPTMLEMAGLEHPKTFNGNKVEPMRGHSMTGVLSATRKEVYAANEFQGGEMQNGKWMRQGDLKAVSVAPPFGTGKWALYDVVKDPGETRDLANEKPEALSRLMQAWDQYAKDVGVVLTGQ